MGGILAPTARAADDVPQQWQQDFDAEILPIIQSRCVECHNDETAEGEFNLAQFQSGQAAAEKLDLWDRVGKRIRLNEMPPAGSPGLSDPQKGAFYRWLDGRPQQDLCNQLATDETQAWYRGHVMSRRLTRTEYTNALRDLLGITLPPDIRLPSDGSGGEGFDTVGDSLFTSPIHLEAYLRAADWAVDQVIAGPAAGEAMGLTAGDVPNRENAAEIVGHFAARAWRGPLEEGDLERLMQLYDASIARGETPIEAVGQACKAILLGPRFLFVVERESPSGGVQRLSPHELAMRLSLFIWSSIPDQELLDAADSGSLYEEDVLRAQVARMLADRRAERLGENFGLQWLGLAELENRVQPDREVVPEFSPELVEDFRREAVITVASVFRQNRSLLELVDAPRITVNRRLAAHYGIPDLDTHFGDAAKQAEVASEGADADSWIQLPVADGRRGGVLTMGAVLASTSYPRRTSPVLRGQWILSEVLGAPVPPPPPGVPALEEVTGGPVAQTLRERLELHRAKPECASCHDRMDPLGFGLENYDLVGRWRDSDAGNPVDARGALPSGQTFEGPAELKQVVLQRRDEFEKHFVRKLLGFALGRELNKFDQCVIDACLERLQAEEHRAACLIETICLSYPFQHRYFKAPEGPQS